MLDAVVSRLEMKAIYRHGARNSSSRSRRARPAVNYPDSVQFLYALGNEIKTAKLGSGAHPRRRWPRWAILRTRPQFVHVAGTNGKGSVCAMIEAGLRAAPDSRTGLFTSPHLAEPTERIRIDGAPVIAARFAEAPSSRIHACVRGAARTRRDRLHTTYFETVTAMAF